MDDNRDPRKEPIMAEPDWTTDEYLSNIAADELRQALERAGVAATDVTGSDDGRVFVRFRGLPDAEAFLTLSLLQDPRHGSLYDRASSSCATLASLHDLDDEERANELAEEAMAAGWTWLMHPHMRGRSVGWHVAADMPHADANAVTATLNAMRTGGAL